MSARTRPLLLAALVLAACSSPGPDKTPTPTPTTPNTTPTTPASPAPEAAPAAPRPATPPALAKGERRKLDVQPEADARKRFSDALGRGRKATVKKDYPAAIAAFDEALVALPGHARALSGRGYARLLAGDLDAAEADLKAALGAAGTPELESVAHFNLGLVAEARGNADAARQRFAIANTLRPSKAAAAKLAGAKTCPVTIDYTGQQELFADFRALWDYFKTQGYLDGERPTDEAAAKAAICKTVDITDPERAVRDACDGLGPWMIFREDKSYLWTAHVLEEADAGQLRLHTIGYDAAARCGQRYTYTKLNLDLPVFRVTSGYGMVVDVMEKSDGEIVECDYEGECMTACGEDEVEIIDYIFNPFTIRPVAIHRPEESTVELRIDGAKVTVVGAGCEQEVVLREPAD